MELRENREQNPILHDHLFFWHEPKDAKNLVLLLDGRALFEVYRIGDFSFWRCSYMLLRGKRSRKLLTLSEKLFFAF